jgi:hypothetical protein
MTETDKIVYRSTHPDVLAHWQNTASAEAQSVWREKVNKTLADLGFPGRRFATSDGFDDCHVVGVEHPEGEDIPAGWRRHKDLPVAITPDKRRAAGKRAVERLAAIPRPNPRKKLPGGMPHVGFGISRFLKAGIARYGDAVYVTWSGELEKGDASNIDPAVWERVKLSEYYAAREQHEAAKTDA